MLSRAAKKFDAAFAALPADAQHSLALFGVRSLPLLEQLGNYLGPIFDDPKIKEATADMFMALALQIVKRASIEKAINVAAEELPDNAPRFAALVRAVINGQRRQPGAPTAALTEADTKPERLTP